jgi:hypothetical protein
MRHYAEKYDETRLALVVSILNGNLGWVIDSDIL